MRERHEFLVQCAQELFEQGVLDPEEIYLNDDALIRAVGGYFLLSEAYKQDRLGHTEDAPHWTEGPKKAALTAVSLMVFRPLRYVAPQRPLNSTTSFVANQVLLLACCASFLERDFPRLTWEPQRRLFKLLDTIGLDRGAALRVRSLREYHRDQRANRVRQTYEINVEADRILIDALVLLFESPLGP